MIYAIIDDENMVQTIISSMTKPDGATEYPDSAEIYQGCDARFFDDAGCRISVDQAVGMGLIDPVGENQTTVWESGRYVVKSDYTNTVYWNKETRDPIRLKLGEEPDDTMTDIQPSDPEAVWIDTEWVVPDEVLAARIRSKRDLLINEFGGRYQRYEREERLGLPHKIDIEDIDNYIQALADIPSQEGFPNIITWPDPPIEENN